MATIKVTEPGEEWSIDTIGPLPEDIDGYKYIIVMVDSMTTFLEAEPTRGVTADEAAQAILKLCGRYGVPRSIRSDNGPQYAARLIECLLALLGTDRHPALEYRPESNGIVERCNAEIMRHFRAVICDRRLQKEWSRYVPMAMRIVNGTASTSTGTKAARIMFGDAVDIDRCLLPTKIDGKSQSLIEEIKHDGRRMVVEDYIRHLTDAQKVLVEASAAHVERVVKEWLAKTPAEPTEFEPG